MSAGWVRVWCGPSIKDEGLGVLSAKYRYKEAQSRERYLKRDDAIKESFSAPRQGEVGTYQHIRFIETQEEYEAGCKG